MDFNLKVESGLRGCYETIFKEDMAFLPYNAWGRAGIYDRSIQDQLDVH